MRADDSYYVVAICVRGNNRVIAIANDVKVMVGIGNTKGDVDIFVHHIICLQPVDLEIDPFVPASTIGLSVRCRQECLLRRVGTDKGTIRVVEWATAAEARHCLDKLRGGVVRGAHGAFGRVDGKAPELPIQPDRAETGGSDKSVLAAISYTSNWP